MKKILVLVMCVNLAACAQIKGFVAPDFSPIDCRPYPYPQALNLSTLKAEEHYTNEATHWEFTHEGFEVLISWLHEIERYSIGVTELQVYTEDCINKYNEVQQGTE